MCDSHHQCVDSFIRWLVLESSRESVPNPVFKIVFFLQNVDNMIF